ncbi:MAG: class II aldolase/adducin family protein [Alphaproteobacteria bacterium]|jgi:ribulose-5-phosphate 4-epimerase/fuculose-1-phosphate aldolase
MSKIHETAGQTARSVAEPAEAPVEFRTDVAERLIKYGRMVVARGYIHNSLGNIAIRVPHPAFPHGVAYAKHAGVSLEEMEIEHVVITDIPSGRLLHGSVQTSVGHKLNREILRLRPDINAVIHVHHDETIAHFAAGRLDEIKAVSLEYPYVMAKPAHVVPSHLDVEADVGPIEAFIQDTNAVIMVRHGITTLGRNVSEAYHRLNTLTSEVRRIVATELLAAARGTEGDFLTSEEVRWMYERAEDVIYPEGSAVFGEDL